MDQGQPGGGMGMTPPNMVGGAGPGQTPVSSVAPTVPSQNTGGVATSQPGQLNQQQNAQSQQAQEKAPSQNQPLRVRIPFYLWSALGRSSRVPKHFTQVRDRLSRDRTRQLQTRPKLPETRHIPDTHCVVAASPHTPGNCYANYKAGSLVAVSQVPRSGSVAQLPEQPGVVRLHHRIWQGVLQWNEKAEIPNFHQKLIRQVSCCVSTDSRDGEPDLKADLWPQKIFMQLMPKQVIIDEVGRAYLMNSKNVLFHPQQCEALESLTKEMSSGFVGCVTTVPTPACNVKVLILFYAREIQTYIGIFPNDQTAFVDRLHKVIQHHKNAEQVIRQQDQGGAGPGQQRQRAGPQGAQGKGPPAPTGILMSQTNQVAMGGGRLMPRNPAGGADQLGPITSQASPIPKVGLQVSQVTQSGSVAQLPKQPGAVRPRHTIWQGVLQWVDLAEIPYDHQKLTNQVSCRVSTNSRDGEPDLKAGSWPPNLIMHLIPKQVMVVIGTACFENSKQVLFHPQQCEARESLTTKMSSGFAGCVIFTRVRTPSVSNVKILILIYSMEKRSYIGLFPSDQAAFDDRLRKAIQHYNNARQVIRQQGQQLQYQQQMLESLPGLGP